MSGHPRIATRQARAMAVSGLAIAIASASLHPAHAGPSSAGWYDATPWLSWVRPSVRSSAASIAGVARLEDLPLYDLDLKLDGSGGAFDLHQVVYLTNLEAAPSDEWVFRLYANVGKPPAPLLVPVLFVKGTCIDAECTVRPDGPTIIAVHPRNPVPPGGRIKVSLDLRGTLERIDRARTNVLAQSLEGLASLVGGGTSGHYGLLAEGDGIFSLANFYPVLARRHGSIWDRTLLRPIGDLGSDDLANVHATLDLPAALHLAHNGVVLRQEVDERTSRRRIEIGAAMVRDFVVLAGADLASSSSSVQGVTVTSHYRGEDRAAGAQVLDVAVHALRQFESRFGSYPYARLDAVEAPLVGGAGGVEFSGLFTVASMFYHREPLMTSLLPEGSTTPMREFVTAHEVAHQWWHALVGSDSRDAPFTDESLAQYSAILYLEDRYGHERAKRDGDMNVKMNYRLMRMLGLADGAADGPVASFSSPLSYGGLVYGKGPYFFSEVRKVLGDKAFFEALHSYVSRYRFRTAPPRGFVDLLAAPGHEAPVEGLARRWLHESHGDEDLGADAGAGNDPLSALLGGKGGKLPLDPLNGQNLGGLVHELLEQLGTVGSP